MTLTPIIKRWILLYQFPLSGLDTIVTNLIGRARREGEAINPPTRRHERQRNSRGVSSRNDGVHRLLGGRHGSIFEVPLPVTSGRGGWTGGQLHDSTRT